jgi:hypothetical protein
MWLSPSNSGTAGNTASRNEKDSRERQKRGEEKSDNTVGSPTVKGALRHILF